MYQVPTTVLTYTLWTLSYHCYTQRLQTLWCKSVHHSS